MSPFTILLTLAALVPLIVARTLELSPRQSTNSSAEYLPPILVPQGGILWTAGANYTVTWNTTIPTNVTSAEATQAGQVVLGYITQNPFSENLGTVLATPNFYVLPTDGYVNITLPADLPARSTYIIALVGKTTRVVSDEFSIQVALPVSSTSTSAVATSTSASGTASVTSSSALPTQSKSSGSRAVAGGLLAGVAVAVAALA